RGLSWERTVEHLLGELDQNSELRALRKSAHLIVNFEHDGAVWIDFANPKGPLAHLIYDAANAEGEWAEGIKGESFGYLTCLTAAVTQRLVSAKPKEVDLQPAI